jgi:hypothetical protein
MKISGFVKLILIASAILAILFPALAALNFEPRLWPDIKVSSIEQNAQVETPSISPSIGYDSQPITSMRHEKLSAKYNRLDEMSVMDDGPTTAYNSFWDTSLVKLDSYGRLTIDDIDGLLGADYNLRASNMDVLTRGLLSNGISYILVANPKNMPVKVLVNPQVNNWNMQYVQVKYGNILVAKLGNQMRITVPASQSGMIIINTPPRKRYSFTAGPKPAYSFRAGPKPPYSFRAGPKPPYSFRIGY